ncbi:DUF6992 family protein [Pontibacter flavimaris]|uniref:Uncharacterized protein n=1 Tax=Pontibacter flavimaris TaxID=1797110 RepID=A0A1Q5PFP1_9BACT|nr:hypothetical protein [Pontibacter flavimaris]OKL41044.1 hypothetical protein A3841_14550 [Pontibacter flavimaris]
MRKHLYLLPLLFLGLTAGAQAQSLSQLNQGQAGTLETGMLVLGGWAILNILFSSFKLTKATRSRKYFYQMNVYWNIINLLIASFALYVILSKDNATLSLAGSLQLHDSFKKVLYLSLGLDFGFILLGAYLKERSRVSIKTEQVQGWGQSIMLQGAFLLLLDVVLVVLLEQYAEPLFRMVQ